MVIWKGADERGIKIINGLMLALKVMLASCKCNLALIIE